MEQNTLQVELVPIDKLFCSPSNPRINDPAIPHVAASIKRFGWQQPVVAKPSGEVIAGNTRLKAAQSLGLTEIPVIRFVGADIDAVAYSIADNKSHEHSAWDDEALAKLLQQLKEEDSLEAVGFDDSEIDQLLQDLEDDDHGVGQVDDPGPVAPPEEPITKIGDLWRLDDHLLLCGDSTKADDIARLMGGEKAALLSTDPPYCVNYTGNDRPIHDGKPSGKDWSNVYREVDIKDLGEFLDSAFSSVLPHVEQKAAIYVWHAHVQQPTIARAFEQHGLLLHQVIVWVKPCATFGHSYYRWRHEPCAFGWRRGNKPTHGTGKLDTVWDVDWDGRQRISGEFHPTEKPTRLFEIPMEQHTKRGDIVLEPFCGSGSQIIAAEKLGRKCRAMELQPAFIDGTIKRWEKATGKAAVLDADGRTFEEISRERSPTVAEA